MADAGWYPDPGGSSAQRYFDGSSWTDHLSGPAPAPGLGSGGYPAPQAPFGGQVTPGSTAPQWSAPPRPSAPYPYGAAPPYGYGQPVAVAPKSPAVSLLISFFIPGVGSMVNGDVGIGVFILIGYLVSIVLIFVLVGIVLVPAFWIWGLVDAYQGAQRWNARHGIVS